MKLDYCYINLIIKDFADREQVLRIYNIYNLGLLSTTTIKYLFIL